MAERYDIPAQTHRVEDSIKKSRFIASVAHVEDVEAARAFVASIKDEFADATHNCWAFVAGPAGDSGQVGMSDDGEPHGTAGKPMLAALLGSGVGEVAVVVTRYYGGTKLGTGGLVRAYSGMVALALESLPTKQKVDLVRLRVGILYNAVTLFKRALPDFEAEVVEEAYGAEPEYVLEMPEEHEAPFRKHLADLTNGTAHIETIA